MACAIWKYTLGFGVAVHPMPAGAEILTVQMQHGLPTLWARVDTDAPKVHRAVACYGTGWDGVERGAYIATVQYHDGTVWHFFDQGPTSRQTTAWPRSWPVNPPPCLPRLPR